MSRIRWIHFSDLHLNLTGTETKRLRENLLEYLNTIVGKIDYAFLRETFDMHQVEISLQMLEKK